MVLHTVITGIFLKKKKRQKYSLHILHNQGPEIIYPTLKQKTAQDYLDQPLKSKSPQL